MTERLTKKLFVSLAGRLRVWTEDGHQIRLKKRSRRVIAILLLEPDMQMTRERLRMCLWPDSPDPDSNLRNVTRCLRKELGAYRACFRVEKHGPVALVGVEDRTKRIEGVDEEFFEDGGLGPEEFDDWFRLAASSFDNLPLHPKTTEDVVHTIPRPRVALVSAQSSASNAWAAAMVEWIADRLRDILVLNAFVEFYDLRYTSSATEFDMELRVSANDSSGDVEISIGAFCDGQCKLSESHSIPSQTSARTRTEELQVFAHRAAARIEADTSQLTLNLSEGRKHPQLYLGVSKLFSMRLTDLWEAIALFEQGTAPEIEATTQIWRAYSNLFAWSEIFECDHDGVLSRAETALTRAMDLAPGHPGGLSTSALYWAGVAGDFKRARRMSDEALSIAPFSPFALQTRATIAMWDGNLGEAAWHCNRANRLGRYGPMRFCIDSTEVALFRASEEHEKAARLGRDLLRSRPDCIPVLRHTIASLEHLDQRGEAGRLQSGLRDLQRLDFLAPALV